jgi:transcriptional regulator with XRE-family HTH domain
LNGLGPALRWLRDRRGRKQYQVAAAAGITKGMLSAYETGRQRPSLETLDKILDTLGCDLNDLHNSLRIVNGDPGGLVRTDARRGPWPAQAGAGSPGAAGDGAVDVYGALGITEQLPEQEERALSEMLQGFHRLLRFLHTGLPTGPSQGGQPDGEGRQGKQGGPAAPGEAPAEPEGEE